MIELYIDGGCRGNPGIGAAGLVALNDGKVVFEKALYDGGTTTNNRMEMTSMMMALHHLCDNIGQLNKDEKINIYSDSNIIVNTINLNWRRNANKDLWDEIDELINQLTERKIKFNLVKVEGHSGNEFNERVDKLVNQCMDDGKDVIYLNRVESKPLETSNLNERKSKPLSIELNVEPEFMDDLLKSSSDHDVEQMVERFKSEYMEDFDKALGRELLKLVRKELIKKNNSKKQEQKGIFL